MTSYTTFVTDIPTSNITMYSNFSSGATVSNVTLCDWNISLNQTVCDMVTNVTTSTPVTEVLPPHSLWLTILLGTLAAVISIVTVLGNITVLLAFGLERSIRQPTNYFLASLAVSDLLIGTFSMPLYTQYLLFNFWPLGPWLCDLWLSLDWTVCLTSQYTVFFITMDRFLSVKIPAKYRNWRTERKVLIMIAITWVFPSVIFFTSIIGWQYFVGERTVPETNCEVQFMSTSPLFTFLLTIGYYWITLVVMCGLYAGIYKVALKLQRKSDAKQRKLEHTMELAADNSATRNTASNSSDSAAHGGGSSKKARVKKKSQKGSEGKGSGGTEHNNVTKGKAIVSTTTFSAKNKLGPTDRCRQDSIGGGSVATDTGDNKEEDRSSSPAFASDDENSSSGTTPATTEKPGGFKSSKGSKTTANNHKHLHKSPLNPKAGIAGIVNTAMLTNPDSFHPHVNFKPINDALNTTAPDLDGTPMPPAGQCLRPTHGGPTYTLLQPQQDICGDHESAVHEGDSLYSSSNSDRLERSTVPLLEPDVLKVCRYIDENSFLDMTARGNVHISLGQSAPDSVTTPAESVMKDGEGDSPLWKRRNSVPLPPLASDVFDIVIDDDYMTDFGITDTTLASAVHSVVKVNGEDVPMNNKNKYVKEAGSTDPPTHPHTETEDDQGGEGEDSQYLSASRRPRKGDGKIHSFVKSVRSRNSRRRNRRERKSKSENRARKALRTITIILGAFVLCWTPYHIMVFVIAICGGTDCINIKFYSFTYWLCYLNSPINPFCYAFANAQFKRTFLRILRFDWHRT